MNVEQRIKELALARQEVIDLERQYADVLDKIRIKKRIAAGLEDAIRSDALAYFSKTGDRLSMHEVGVGIQSVNRERWDTERNLIVAHSEAPSILRVNNSEFKRWAGTLAPTLPLEVLELDESALKDLRKDDKADWAKPEVTTENVVYIKSKLGEYLL